MYKFENNEILKKLELPELKVIKEDLDIELARTAGEIEALEEALARKTNRVTEIVAEKEQIVTVIAAAEPVVPEEPVEEGVLAEN